MSETEILKEVKTLIGLKDEDDKQDSVLNVLISNTASQFEIILGELSYLLNFTSSGLMS